MLLDIWQTTLQRPLIFEGKGLHSGRLVRMHILPAPCGHGIRFMRSDIVAARSTRALASSISGTTLGTTLGEGATSIASVEHLLAAFSGLGIANAEVLINGPEIPAMDGSSLVFAKAILDSGIMVQDAPALAYRLKKPFTVRQGDRVLQLEPATATTIHCSIDFRAAFIGRQSISYQPSLESFLEIAGSRYFCHMSDIRSMREEGLALGGSLDNALVVTDDSVLNQSGLRSPDEFVRHKLLDLLGDLSLLGAPLVAEIKAHKSGHGLHAEAARILLEEKSIYLDAFEVPATMKGIDRSLRFSAKNAAQLA